MLNPRLIDRIQDVGGRKIVELAGVENPELHGTLRDLSDVNPAAVIFDDDVGVIAFVEGGKHQPTRFRLTGTPALLSTLEPVVDGVPHEVQ